MQFPCGAQKSVIGPGRDFLRVARAGRKHGGKIDPDDIAKMIDAAVERVGPAHMIATGEDRQAPSTRKHPLAARLDCRFGRA